MPIRHGNTIVARKTQMALETLLLLFLLQSSPTNHVEGNMLFCFLESGLRNMLGALIISRILEVTTKKSFPGPFNSLAVGKSARMYLDLVRFKTTLLLIVTKMNLCKTMFLNTLSANKCWLQWVKQIFGTGHTTDRTDCISKGEWFCSICRC